MAKSRSNWHEIAPSQFPWEREALDFVRERFPTHEPYWAWTNVEFIAHDGTVNEVDLLAVTPAGFFLVEIKSRPGKITGDASHWTWKGSDGRLATADNPLLLAERKAKRLASLLRGQKAFKRTRCPFVEAVVFCSAEDQSLHLTGPAGNRVFLRDRAQSGDAPARDGIVAALINRRGAGMKQAVPGIARPEAKAIARAFDQAGIRPSQRARRVADDALFQAAALVQLWTDGFVEPVVPPERPAHILTQQIMALALQESGIGTATWEEWIGRVPGFAAIPPAERRSIVRHMLSSDILAEDQGILWFDREGERRFGYKNFMELCSVFTSPPLFTVLHGRDPVGFVHQTSFLRPEGEPCVLLLSGRSWEVTHLDWVRKTAQVKPVARAGRSRWLGTGASLSGELSQAIRELLVGGCSSDRWSKRASERMEELLAEYTWVRGEETFLVRSPDGCRWWTFAGTRANMALAGAIQNVVGIDARAEGLFIHLSDEFSLERLAELRDACQGDDAIFLPEDCLDEQLKHLKFSVCLPEDVQRGLYASRLLDIAGAREAALRPLHVVSTS